MHVVHFLMAQFLIVQRPQYQLRRFFVFEVNKSGSLPVLTAPT